MKIRRIIIAIVVILLIASCISIPMFAQESADNVEKQQYVNHDFDDVEIVTEDTYVPVDTKVPNEMNDNAVLGSALEKEPQTYAVEAKAKDPEWKLENGNKNFYNGYGELMYHQGTQKVIDVSEHNGKIDWEKVKQSGIDGAILRVGYGNRMEDKYFKRNIEECNRLGIPYGIYLYSYAYDENFAYAEAEGTVEMLSKYHVNLSYPIFYDIEAFDSWNDGGVTRRHPTTVAEYEKVIGTYLDYMNKNGYAGKVHVYSYRSYANGVLNSPAIHSNLSWVAEYGAKLNFTNKHYAGEQGWQYTSSGSVNGIKGRVDLNCFSSKFYNKPVSENVPVAVSDALTRAGVRFSGGYLSGMQVGTNLDTLIKELSSVGSVTCFDKNGAIVNGGSITTGTTIDVTISLPEESSSVEAGETPTLAKTQTYTMMIVLKGDVDGDGRIRSIDYSLVKNDILNIRKLSSAFFLAGDVDGDGKIRSIDYSLIKNDILNIRKITQ